MNMQTDTANVAPQRSLSWIWLIPLIAACVAGWILYDHYRSIGPTISITFTSAEGIEPGKTKVKIRDVDVGTVSSVSLSDNNKHVIVKVQMKANTERFLVDGSQFWVVSPRITHKSITGLNTLLSGSYIEMSVGERQVEKYQFTGLQEPPVTPVGTPGLHITLNSDDKFAYSEGDPIIYKGLTVGKFEDVYFDFEERIVYYNAFINAPYHQLVTTNTRFWNASGLDITLDADGINLRTGNAETLLTNGVSFAVPAGVDAGQPVKENATFDIYPTRALAQAVRYNQSIEFVVLINDSVRGLSEDAPVEYRGLEIGKVKQVNMPTPGGQKMLERDYQIPVLVALYPGMAGLPDTADGRMQMENQIEHWVRNGMAASLTTGNLLTGKQVMELQHYETDGITDISYFDSYMVIPSQAGEFSQIAQKVSGLLDKLNQLPLENLTQDATRTLADISTTMQQYDQTGKKLDSLVAQLQEGAMAEKLTQALTGIAQLTQAYTDGSLSNGELNRMMENINQTLADLQPLLKQLSIQPNSLVFPTDIRDELVPGGAREN